MGQRCRSQCETEVPDFHTGARQLVARPEGFEPPTLGLEVRIAGTFLLLLSGKSLVRGYVGRARVDTAGQVWTRPRSMFAHASMYTSDVAGRENGLSLNTVGLLARKRRAVTCRTPSILLSALAVRP